VMELIKADPNIRVIMREYPILSPLSQKASQVALASFVIDPKKYIDVHNGLMAAELHSDESLYDVVKKSGLAVDQVKEKVQSPEVQRYLTDNRNLGRTVGIQGTPAFIIGGELIPGAISIEEMKERVAEARRKSSAKAN
jgi:protein-disulfide isomerase